MFESTKNIINQIEMALLNLKEINNPTIVQQAVFKYLEFYKPNKYIYIGLCSFYKPLKEFIKMLILIIIAIFIIYIMPLLSITYENIIYIVLIFCLYIPFALPSTYAFDNIEKIHLIKITNILKKNNFDNIDKLEFFEENLKNIKIRVIERINAIKWIVGALWILVTFVYSQYITISSNIIKNELIQFLKVFINDFSFLIGLLIIMVIFIASYKRGVDFIFRSIEFALIQFKYEIKCNKNDS